MPDGLHAAPAYEPEHYCDRVFPELRRAKRLIDAGTRRLQNALDRAPGGYTHDLMEMAESALMDTVLPELNDALDRVTGGTP